MTALQSARTAIFDALNASGMLPPDRIAPSPPLDANAPAAWVELASGSTRSVGQGSVFVVASFVVRIIVDGTDPSQVDALDVLVCEAFDALDVLPTASVAGWRPTVVDVGGPNLRGVDMTVDYTITARTLCAPETAASLNGTR